MADRLTEGIFFFNAGRFFDAHEAWEDMWRAEPGELRFFYQGLVHAAVGLHHLSRKNLLGGRSQLTKSLNKLDRYPDHTAGIDVAKLRQDLRCLLADPEREIQLEICRSEGL